MDSADVAPFKVVDSLPDHSIESMLSKAASSTKEELESLEMKLSKLTVPHLKEIGRKFHVRISMLGKKKSDIVKRLLAFGQEGKLDTSLLTTDSPGATKLSLDETAPSLTLTVEDWLLRGEKNGDGVWICLRKALKQLTSDGLRVVADAVAAKLTGTSSKVDIIERLIVLSQVGSLQNRSDNDVPRSLSYMTDAIKKQLSELPTFENIHLWSKSLSSVNFHFINLYTYLVESRDKTFDRDSLRAFKSLKGYKYFADGFVDNMWLYKHQPTEGSKSNLVVLRAFCHHSLTCGPALKVFVSFNGTSGDVYTASCNCVSGLGAACSHIAACLFALEKAVSNGCKELPCQISPTSQPMAWNQPPKKIVKPQPITEISFSKSSFGTSDNQEVATRSRSDFDPRSSSDRELDRDSLDRLLADVRDVFPQSGLLHFWQKNNATSNADGLHDLDADVCKLILNRRMGPGSLVNFPNLRTDEVNVLLSTFVADENVLRRAEVLTRGQAEKDLWHELRRGRLTSSRFGEVLHRRASTPPDSLVSRLFHPPQRGTTAMQWGRNHEMEARQMYLQCMDGLGNAVRWEESGLHLHPGATYLGASSDGLLFDSSVDGSRSTMGCLEIKCPYSMYGTSVVNITPAAIAAKFPSFFLKPSDSGRLQLSQSHSYYAQVQGEMAIIGCEWADFVVYTLAGVHVSRIQFDQAYWERQLFPALRGFFSNHVLPQLDIHPFDGSSVSGNGQTGDQESTVGNDSLGKTGIQEIFLESDQCQSRIRGRNGSNACTIISALMASLLLSKKLAVPATVDDVTSDFRQQFCQSMVDGNALYDSKNYTGLLSMDDVLDEFPQLGMRLHKEVFAHDGTTWEKVLAMLTDGEKQIAAGVIIQTPMSMAIAASADMVVVLDSHAHGLRGAQISIVKKHQVVAYLQHLFPRGVAHFNLLQV